MRRDPLRLGLLLALPVAAAAPLVLAPQEGVEREASGELVLDRFVQYGGRPLHIRFETETRQLVIVGEADRPFVHQENEGFDALWWTTLADLREAPEIEYLVREQARRIVEDPERDVDQLPERFRTDPDLALVPVRIGTEVTGRVNANEGEVDPKDPAHYRALTTTSTLEPYLLVNAEGRLDLVIPAANFEGLFFEGEMEGEVREGDRFGGLRLDLVFHGILDLVPPTSMQWMGDVALDSLPLRHHEPEEGILGFTTR